MYEQHWKLKKKPFSSAPDPEFFYASKGHELTLLKLSYAVQEGVGGAVVVGQYGAGKTLALDCLLDRLAPERYVSVKISNPLLPADELLATINAKLLNASVPATPDEVTRSAILSSIEDALRRFFLRGRRVLLIVDEAHLIQEKDAFEALRLLLNYYHDKRFLMTLMLVGQSELDEKLRRFPHVEQRMSIRCVLPPLSEDEVDGYIHHRLKVAGGSPSIFAPGTSKIVFGYSEGIPRLINRLCDLALLIGYGLKAQRVDSRVLHEAINDFQRG